MASARAYVFLQLVAVLRIGNELPLGPGSWSLAVHWAVVRRYALSDTLLRHAGGRAQWRIAEQGYTQSPAAQKKTTVTLPFFFFIFFSSSFTLSLVIAGTSCYLRREKVSKKAITIHRFMIVYFLFFIVFIFFKGIYKGSYSGLRNRGRQFFRWWQVHAQHAAATHKISAPASKGHHQRTLSK